MSKIGRQPIPLQGATATIADGQLTVQGKRGSLSLTLHPAVQIVTEGDIVRVTVGETTDLQQRALWGTYRSLIANMVLGVTTGFTKKLEISGVGFTVELKGKKLMLKLGFSHPVEFPLPEGIVATVEKSVITLTSNDKQLLGETAARLRGLKPPEPYKGKGIKYSDEIVRRKAGKVVKASG